ncbi:phosphate ABC transporter ATP-binding protein [Macrococcus hajekii]|uniref:Phosphate ABC transporter ATP-binding protein n=1 Tax=Macrococcus hajekii TaxID=198482 RepID=A0A4R6BNQ6_9STAP|nr:phosphate ABC transporter ATP-binding protein [Macrococcus hajekii]TDM03503.1 phosphate ABC transporter ATP-binding protein [Macrococcus hajekii]GGA99372.1 putative ABC transporter ATP-binding protein YjkB [Macrococcus hajekii]
MSTIQLDHINVIRNDQHILHDISCTFPSGTITALIGPSGAGKTTLLKLLNGLHSPTSGEIYFDDAPLSSMNLLQLRADAGMALQSAPMISGTVYDNLNLPCVIKGESLTEEVALQLLDQVNLDNVPLSQDIKSLSGGQRQRLSIARTLVNQPKVLLLDEITSSLDPRSVKEVEKLIHRIHQDHQVTIIWITHDVDQAARATERYVMLRDGHVEHIGKSSTLLNSEHATVRDFIEGEEL